MSKEKKRLYHFDEKCYELAEYFYPGLPKDFLSEVAEAIQVEVEGWEPDEESH